MRSSSLKKEQVKKDITYRILSGQYLVNGRIPPERELCDTMAVSRITVRAAVDDLIAEGILRRDGRRGTIICKIPSTDIAGTKKHGKRLLFLYFSSIRGHVVEQSGTSSRLYHGVERFANEHHYSLMVQSGENFLCQANPDKLEIDGVIVGGTLLEKYIPILTKAGIPAIVVDSIPHMFDIDAISGDYYEAGARAAELVIRRKLKNPLFIQLKFDDEGFIQPNLLQRQRGFMDTAGREGLDSCVHTIDYRDLNKCGKTVEELFALVKKRHIDGIVYSADFEYSILSQYKTVGDIYSVVIGGVYAVPPSDKVSQVIFDMEYIGYLAAQRISRRILNPCLEAVRILIPCKQ
ncbi:MAG TPA: GntR family transcriptional regulator [Phycisphaerae bacterium]|nr:GntR family transcriptional regulator [Phycisphaerae bacterium]